MSEYGDWKAYTDGACKGNPGPAGWGVVLFNPAGQTMELFGPMEDMPSTNQRAELYAAIQATREALRHGAARITLYTDSMYVITLVKSGGIANRDLVDILQNLKRDIDIRTQKVLAHSGDRYNEMADRLAVRGAIVAQSQNQTARTAPGDNTASLPLEAPGGSADELEAVLHRHGLKMKRNTAFHIHVYPLDGSPVLNYYPSRQKLYSPKIGTITGIGIEQLVKIAKGSG